MSLRIGGIRTKVINFQKQFHLCKIAFMSLLSAQNMWIVYIFYIIAFSITLVFHYLFSNTFEFVHTNSEKLWHYHLYTVIKDYNHRIPSPINLIWRPIAKLISLKSLCRSTIYIEINDRLFTKVKNTF